MGAVVAEVAQFNAAFKETLIFLMRLDYCAEAESDGGF